jgi:hypothetical protein
MNAKSRSCFRNLALALLVAAPVFAFAQRYEDFTVPRPLPPHSTIIIGILGGIEHHGSMTRPVNVVAAHLRSMDMPNVFVETVEHAHGKLAYRLITEALDRDRNGRLDEDERKSARIILYGHSMGAAAVVKLATKLERIGVPVQLTVQVDSIGTGDRDIPTNVVHAVNFYQRDALFLKGLPEIRARNPKVTEILGNFKYSYHDKKGVDMSVITPIERAAGGAHTRMEFDPEVWLRVEDYIIREIK